VFIEFTKTELPGLIGLVGTPAFLSGVMGAANRAVVPVDSCALFRYDAAGRPANFGTASCVSEEATHQTAERYVAGLGLHDPMRLSLQTLAGGVAPTLFHMRRDRIDHPGYREQCFVRTGTLERMSVLCGDDHARYAINFYRTHQSGPFQANELAALGELAPLLSSLTLKHVAVSGLSQAMRAEPPAARITRRLRDHARLLSDRECEICTLIVLGHTSESIARKLGLTGNTVLTYRKRAYRKLQIGSQNELFRICLE
jgi:DNA-binding CsgD family transcriptional regulator